ncbi:MULTISPECIES: DNA polymerase III subunit delta [Clostridium]|uniref:DNA polymerase III subunit delta n=1 Tax=Clostridium TaxID=1485 RepID=UPI0008254944|nr:MULTISPECIES: DNA polymerase III subunit delta [Clostridium]PJI10233.1 DNA polymerase III subunit delta [Clostridium sp. CT7]
MINFQELRNQLRMNRWKNAMILYSVDYYSIKTIIEQFKNYIEIPELNISYLNDIDNMKQIVNACETLPFMSKRRLVLLKSDFLEPSSKDKNNLLKDISKYISDVPITTILILYSFQKDKRENVSKNKKLLKLERIGASVVVSPKNNSYAVRTLVQDFSRKYNLKLSKDAENFITSNSSNNLDFLINDLSKLRFMDELSIENIKKVFSSLNDQDIFDFTEAISNKDRLTSLEILNSLTRKGETPIGILFMLIRQFKLLFYAKISIEKNVNSEEFAKKNKLHPYFGKIIYSQSKNFTLNELQSYLSICIKSEIKFKTTGASKVDLEMLLALLI